jgi:hypothetical protein
MARNRELVGEGGTRRGGRGRGLPAWWVCEVRRAPADLLTPELDSGREVGGVKMGPAGVAEIERVLVAEFAEPVSD